MTDKRFKTNEVGCIVDYQDNLRNYDGEEIVELLNELDKKNKQFKIESRFGELLKSIVNVDVEKICLNIMCVDNLDFNLSFIEYEDDEKLVVWVTGADMRERPHIIMKDKIIAVNIVYEEDIKIIENEKDLDMMVG